MYIITTKEDNRIIAMGNQLDHMPNGYPRLIEENIAFPTEMVNVYEVTEVPEGVEAEKYCYTEAEGFEANPNWVEPNPYGIPDALVQQIQDDTVAGLVELGVI